MLYEIHQFLPAVLLDPVGNVGAGVNGPEQAVTPHVPIASLHKGLDFNYTWYSLAVVSYLSPLEAELHVVRLERVVLWLHVGPLHGVLENAPVVVGLGKVAVGAVLVVLHARADVLGIDGSAWERRQCEEKYVIMCV